MRKQLTVNCILYANKKKRYFIPHKHLECSKSHVLEVISIIIALQADSSHQLLFLLFLLSKMNEFAKKVVLEPISYGQYRKHSLQSIENQLLTELQDLINGEIHYSIF